MTRAAYTGAAVACGLISSMLLGQGAYIHVKARLAQHLLRDAWAKTCAGEQAARPWPWADMWPVARLRVPAHGVDLFVLSDASARTLAFGPGHHPNTGRPGTRDVTLLSAHRDTHFAFLQRVRLGDLITLELANGTSRRYAATRILVTDEPAVRFRDDGPTDALVLATCYPFDAVTPGGPARYIVVAEPVRARQPEHDRPATRQLACKGAGSTMGALPRASISALFTRESLRRIAG